jgi:hypothetical protein
LFFFSSSFGSFEADGSFEAEGIPYTLRLIRAQASCKRGIKNE